MIKRSVLILMVILICSCATMKTERKIAEVLDVGRSHNPSEYSFYSSWKKEDGGEIYVGFKYYDYADDAFRHVTFDHCELVLLMAHTNDDYRRAATHMMELYRHTVEFRLKTGYDDGMIIKLKED